MIPITWLIFVSEKNPTSNIDLYYSEYFLRIPSWHEIGLHVHFENISGYVEAEKVRGQIIRIGKDVLKARLDAEYSLPVEFEVSEFQLARWISSDDRRKLDAFIAANGSGVADDVDGDPVFLAKNEFYLGYTKERAEGIVFSSVKDVKKQA